VDQLSGLERNKLLALLAELHDAVIEDHPRVAAWARHCMFRLAENADQFEVIADVDFEEWERSGNVDPIRSLTPPELGFLLSHLVKQAEQPEGLSPVALQAVEEWIAELEEERASRQGRVPPPGAS
jgi:hypothetical protein